MSSELTSKLRGAGKLKFFCQMCRKQCRDENGWNCHIRSNIHQAKMREFAENPDYMIEKFSNEFQKNFIQLLRDRHANKKKRANDVYTEFIEDKAHVHMNATRWTTLNEFCRYMGEKYKNIMVEDKEQMYITYVEVKAKEFVEKVQKDKAKSREISQVDKEWAEIEKRIEKAKLREQAAQHNNPNSSQKEQSSMQMPAVIKFDINPFDQNIEVKRKADLEVEDRYGEDVPLDQIMPKKKCHNAQALINKLVQKTSREPEKQQLRRASESKNNNNTTTSKQESKDQAEASEDIEWIHEGIQVKILPHDIPEQFHNKKGKVVLVPEKYVGRVQTGQSGETLLDVDQTFLETVVPKPGQPVMVLVGKFRGLKGMLQKVDAENGIGTVSIQPEEWRKIQSTQQQEHRQEILELELAVNCFSRLA